ncbi:MAG: nitroreductase family deazaflavin-dependent oxidoreductase [Chloroflexota bacterium]
MESADPNLRRARANGLMRLLFRAPLQMYRGPLADVMASRGILLLTTRGRKSGRPRTAPVSFMAHEGKYIVFSGWGATSNWYRNARADRHVQVSVGQRTFAATAELIADPTRRQDMMRLMRAGSARRGPPPFIRPFLKALRVFDYDGELDAAVRAGPDLPVVEITPT